jgi:hypothetical protein
MRRAVRTRVTAADGLLLVGAGTSFSQTFSRGSAYGSAWLHQHAATGLTGTSTFSGTATATLAPSARICSVHSLPRQAILRLRLAVVDQRCNPVVVTVGAQRFELAPFIEPSEFSLDLQTNGPTDTIDICPSTSMCPREEGWSDDERLLGVKLYTLEVDSSRGSSAA